MSTQLSNGVIGIDHEASEELKKLLSSLNVDASVIRIFISGMGCSGANFNLAMDSIKSNDISFEFEGITYVVGKELIDEFEGFDIINFDNYGRTGLVVRPRKMDAAGGCGSCSGCH